MNCFIFVSAGAEMVKILAKLHCDRLFVQCVLFNFFIPPLKFFFLCCFRVFFQANRCSVIIVKLQWFKTVKALTVTKSAAHYSETVAVGWEFLRVVMCTRLFYMYRFQVFWVPMGSIYLVDYQFNSIVYFHSFALKPWCCFQIVF